MRTDSVKLMAIIVFSLFLISESHAALIEKDDSVFGTGAITLDTDSGLEWLDVTFSTSRTRNYINGQFDSGGEFEGFRYATTEEALALWATVSLNSSDIFENVAYWSDFVDATGSQGGYPEILAMTGSGDSVGADAYYSGGTLVYNTGRLGWFGASLSSGSVGSWLVREASSVPLPGAVWLLGSGILGLIGARRRNS